jgi:hypothetical protein
MPDQTKADQEERAVFHAVFRPLEDSAISGDTTTDCLHK